MDLIFGMAARSSPLGYGLTRAAKKESRPSRSFDEDASKGLVAGAKNPLPTECHPWIRSEGSPHPGHQNRHFVASWDSMWSIPHSVINITATGMRTFTNWGGGRGGTA